MITKIIYVVWKKRVCSLMCREGPTGNKTSWYMWKTVENFLWNLPMSCFCLFVSLPCFNRYDTMTFVGNLFFQNNILCYPSDGHKEVKELLVLHFAIFKAKFCFALFFDQTHPPEALNHHIFKSHLLVVDSSLPVDIPFCFLGNY